MSEYIERDAAIELLSQPITMSLCLAVDECHHKIAQQRIDRYLIENIPAADVRPVVLCAECRHRDPEDHKCDSGQTERQGCPFPVHDDYFCAYGER